MTIRILLIDDHTLFRSGIRALLQRQPDFAVVDEAADGVEGLKRAKQHRPDVILLDLNMPGLSGLETLALLAQDLPDTAVLILTVSEEAEELASALRGGARGYLLKNIEADFLASAIRRAASGEPVISDGMTAKLVAQFRAPAQPSATARPERRGRRAADRAGARDRTRADPGREQQADRARPRRGREHGQDPRAEHPQEAESGQPRTGGGVRGRAWPDRVTASPIGDVTAGRRAWADRLVRQRPYLLADPLAGGRIDLVGQIADRDGPRRARGGRIEHRGAEARHALAHLAVIGRISHLPHLGQFGLQTIHIGHAGPRERRRHARREQVAHLGRQQRAQHRLARGRVGRRQAHADTERDAERAVAVLAGQVDHLRTIEHRQGDRGVVERIGLLPERAELARHLRLRQEGVGPGHHVRAHRHRPVGQALEQLQLHEGVAHAVEGTLGAPVSRVRSASVSGPGRRPRHP